MNTITLARRADSTSTSTKSESATKSSSESSATTSKCTGGTACEKPSGTDSTAVAVAVAVPVAVVLLVLGFVLWKVWRRGKKEALEDNDPDFEGDDEFLPAFGPHYELKENGALGIASRRQFDDFDSQTPPNPFMYENMSGHGSIHTAIPIDPFRLPEVNGTDDLRVYARNLRDNDSNGYRLASRNASEVSLSRPEKAFHRPRTLSSQGRMASFGSSNEQSFGSSSNKNYNQGKEQGQSLDSEGNSKLGQKFYNEYSKELASSQDENNESFEFETSPIKSTRVDVTQGYVDTNAGLDAEKSYGGNDSFELDDSSFAKDSNVDSPSKTGKEVSQTEVDTDDDGYASKFSKEEENIKRMKSIYEVYLDRNRTMKSTKGNGDMQEPDTKLEEIKDFDHFGPTESLPIGASSQIDSAMKIQRSLVEDESSNIDEHSTETEIEAENTNPNSLQIPGQNETGSKARAASSIYSEIPRIPQQPYYQDPVPVAYQQQAGSQEHMPQNQYTQQPMYPNQTQYQQNAQYDAPMQNSPNAYPPNAYPSEPLPYSYPPHAYMPNQRHHPQALENIQELPNPAKLPYSSSSHSLTSFKKRANEVRLPNGVANNGRSFSPIDHPELFYNQNTFSEDSLSTINQQSTGQGQAAHVLPHHLRQSVVMTNPMDLSQPMVFKPAGSFRNLSAANSRNNSMTSQHSIQQYRNQLAHQRVSGILDDSDTFQPPSVGGILPHTGSQEDLRRQLGTSENYTVS